MARQRHMSGFAIEGGTRTPVRARASAAGPAGISRSARKLRPLLECPASAVRRAADRSYGSRATAFAEPDPGTEKLLLYLLLGALRSSQHEHHWERAPPGKHRTRQNGAECASSPRYGRKAHRKDRQPARPTAPGRAIVAACGSRTGDRRSRAGGPGRRCPRCRCGGRPARGAGVRRPVRRARFGLRGRAGSTPGERGAGNRSC